MKKIMVKALLLMLITALTVTLASCGEDNENSADTGSDILDLIETDDMGEGGTLDDEGWSPIFRP